MTATYWGTADGNAQLQRLYTDAVVWLGLHIAEPTPAADPTSEVLGGAYVRERIIFGAPSAKTVGNTNNFIFTDLPASVILWISVWTDQFAGLMRAAIQLPASVSVPAGGQYLGAPGDVAVALV